MAPRSPTVAELEARKAAVRTERAARPRTREAWRSFIGSSGVLTPGERRALEVVYLGGIKPSGVFRGFGWAAEQLGLTRAGFMYRWNSAHYKLGWNEKAPTRRPTISRTTRAALIEEATQGGFCGICSRAIVSDVGLVLDHIVQYAAGGPTTRDNLRAVHLLCNRLRERLPYFAPEHPEWSPLSGRMFRADASRSIRSRDELAPPGLRPRDHLERRMRAERMIFAALRRGAGRGRDAVARKLSQLAIANGGTLGT